MATPYPKSKYRPDRPLVGHKTPSEKQKEAGNYAKGHRSLHGMRISIENEAGTIRRGFGEGGKVWSQRMKHDYGYFLGTKGKDKDHLDVFLGPDHENPDCPVHVIDQNNQHGDFDEHKVMMGFPDDDQALMAYHANYQPGWDRYRSHAVMSLPDFKAWAQVSQLRGKQKPAADYAAVKRQLEDSSRLASEPATQELAGGGLVRKALVEELPGMATKIRNMMAEAGRNKVEMSLIGDANGKLPSMITSGTREAVSPAWAAKIANGPNYHTKNLLDFHTHPEVSGAGVTQSGDDLDFINMRYPKLRYGTKDLTIGIGQPPLDAQNPAQLNLFRTSDPVNTWHPAKTNDAVNELKHAARGGRGAEALYGDAAGDFGTDMGDLLGDLGPLMLLDHYGQTGRGTSRLVLPRQAEESGMSGNEVLDYMRPFYSDILKRKGFAGGGLVKPLVKSLKALMADNEMSHLLPTLQRAADDTQLLGREHGFEQNMSQIKDQRLPFVTRGEPTTVKFPSAATDDGEGLLNVHTHPPGSSPFPSYMPDKATGGRGDIAHWLNRATNVSPNDEFQGLILRPRAEGVEPAYTWRSVGGSGDVFMPGVWDPALKALIDAHRDGAFDPAIEATIKRLGGNQAYGNQAAAMDNGRKFLLSAKNHLPHAYFDDLGATTSAHDLSKPGDKGWFNSLLEEAWPIAHDVLNTTKPGGYASGGSVDDDVLPMSRVTPQMMDDSLEYSRALQPSFAKPLVLKRREDRQDRAGATEIPLQLLRGNVAGTLGFGGDIEKLLRSGANLAGAGVDEDATLPTSDFYKDVLPLKPTSKTGSAAGDLGSMAGMPASTVALKAVRTAPKAAGALSQVAEALAAPSDRMGMAGSRWRQTGAVKMPGGNWVGDGPSNLASDLTEDIYRVSGGNPNDPIVKWFNTKLPKYLQNQMGTTKDPLLALEQEGKLHLTPEQLLERNVADGLGREAVANGVVPGPIYRMPGGAVMNRDPNQFHVDQTGRNYRTGWENLSDAMINSTTAKQKAPWSNTSLAGPTQPQFQDKMLQGVNPQWLKDLAVRDPNAPVHSLDARANQLGFDHVRDYLDAATQAHKWLGEYGGVEGLRAGAAERRAMPGVLHQTAADLMNSSADLAARDLHVDPDKLGVMSLPDVIRKVSDWNDYLAQTKKLQDVNKGIKTVLKQYPAEHPSAGHQWVELDPTGLGDEGQAMGHCVGGYCSEVQRGDSRILSLRDAEGQPHVTVELKRPQFFDMNPRTEEAWNSPSTPWYEKAKNEMEADPKNIALNHTNFWNKFDSAHRRHFDEAVTNNEVPWNIQQIKGKGNRAPVDKYLPAVQDLVKNMGPWGENIRDFKNTGLIKHSEKDIAGMDPAYVSRQYGIKNIPPAGYYTQDEFAKVLQDANPDIELKEFLDTHLKKRDMGYAQGGHVANGRRYLDDGGSAGDGGDSGDSGGDPGTGDPGAAGIGVGEMGTDQGGGVGAGGPSQGGIDPGIFASIMGMLGIDVGPTVGSIGNMGLNIASQMMGLPPGLFGVTNAAVSNNPAAAASSVAGVVGSGLGGVVGGPVGAAIGGIAGNAIGNAVGNMGGVPAGSVPGDPGGGAGGAAQGWFGGPMAPVPGSALYPGVQDAVNARAAGGAGAPAPSPAVAPAAPKAVTVHQPFQNGWLQGPSRNGWGLAKGGHVQRRDRIAGPLSNPNLLRRI